MNDGDYLNEVLGYTVDDAERKPGENLSSVPLKVFRPEQRIVENALERGIDLTKKGIGSDETSRSVVLVGSLELGRSLWMDLKLQTLHASFPKAESAPPPMELC